MGPGEDKNYHEIAGLKLRVDNFLSKEGSRTKIYMSSNLMAHIKRNYNQILDLFHMLISLCFSTLGAEDFRTIIEERWEKLRRKQSNLEQA